MFVWYKFRFKWVPIDKEVKDFYKSQMDLYKNYLSIFINRQDKGLAPEKYNQLDYKTASINHWRLWVFLGNLAINGSTLLRKNYYFFKFNCEGVRSNCFLCDYDQLHIGKQCSNCPADWKQLFIMKSPTPCMNSYYRLFEDHRFLTRKQTALICYQIAFLANISNSERYYNSRNYLQNILLP